MKPTMKRAVLFLLAIAAAAQPLELRNSPRFSQLVRAGSLYLTLDDAIALAIENNLDVEIQRSLAAIAQTEITRTRAGAQPRGLAYSLAETHTGIGGLSSALLTSATRTIQGSSVSTNPFEQGALGTVQSNLAITGTIQASAGASVPNFDPFLTARFNYSHGSALQTNPILAGVTNLITGTTTAGAGYRQGFLSGAQLSLAFDNNRTSTNSIRSSYAPYTNSTLGFNITQPLLRGFGFSVNRRYRDMAANEVKIADLLFRQQLINTVYGVSRLFHDFTAVSEDLKVKQETLKLAEKLFTDTQAQVEEGTLAQVELARVKAQVFSARLDVERSRGLVEEQEAILKTVLTRRGGADPEVRNARLIAVSPAALPEAEPEAYDALVAAALANRADLAQAGLQIANSELSLKGAESQLKPQLDVTAFAQNAGLAGQANPLAASVDPSFLGGYGSALAQILRRNYPLYGAGIQLDLPLRNRAAEADAARDRIQLRQSRLRLQQLENQVRLEVEDALIALRRARASYDAARQARAYQEESLAAEQARFEVGASTSYFVIQFQSLAAQARSSELAARAACLKAWAALRRSTGAILADHNISVEAAR